jgi:hypothetical protein
MDEEVKAKATQMIEAIQKIWPTTPVPTVVLTLFEVQTRLLKVAGNMNTAEALESLQSVLDHVKTLNQ